eukprot:4674426-Prymnesium_polylepis.1
MCQARGEHRLLSHGAPGRPTRHASRHPTGTACAEAGDKREKDSRAGWRAQLTAQRRCSLGGARLGRKGIRENLKSARDKSATLPAPATRATSRASRPHPSRLPAMTRRTHSRAPVEQRAQVVQRLVGPTAVALAHDRDQERSKLQHPQLVGERGAARRRKERVGEAVGDLVA